MVFLYYEDLFKPLDRLLLLSIALEVEEIAMTLCQSPAISKECWMSLSESRRDKAIEKFKELYGRAPELDYTSEKPFEGDTDKRGNIGKLIAGTQLADRGTMIRKKKLIVQSDLFKVKAIFEKLEKVRNRCAHCSNQLELAKLLPIDRLKDFINSAGLIRRSLVAAIEKRE